MSFLEALKSLNLLRTLYNTIPLDKVLNNVTSPLRLTKLADDFYKRDLNAGDIVTVSGYMSKYSQFFTPASYSPMVYEPSNEKNTFSFNRFGKDLRRHQAISFGGMKQAALPMQILPIFKINSLEYHVAFLYPDSFDTFAFSNEDGVSITESNKPIPVFLTPQDHQKHTEQYVKLTAQIQPLPREMIDTFATQCISSHVVDMMYLHFRPESELLGFGLDLRTRGAITKQDKGTAHIRGGIFIEGHIENGPDDMFRYNLGNLIEGTTIGIPRNPTEPGMKSFSFYPPEKTGQPTYDKNIEEEMLMHYLRSDQVNVLHKNNHISLYTDIMVNDDRSRYSSEKKIKETYNLAWRNILQHFRGNGYPEATFQLDFLWDYRKANMFHKGGFLNSEKSEAVFKEDNKLNGVNDWLSEK